MESEVILPNVVVAVANFSSIQAPKLYNSTHH